MGTTAFGTAAQVSKDHRGRVELPLLVEQRPSQGAPRPEEIDGAALGHDAVRKPPRRERALSVGRTAGNEQCAAALTVGD